MVVRLGPVEASKKKKTCHTIRVIAFGYSQLAVNASQQGWLVIGEGVVSFGSMHVLGASETVGSAHMPTQAHRSPSSHRPRSPVIDDPHACLAPRIPMHVGSIRIVSDEICITHCSSHSTLAHEMSNDGSSESVGLSVVGVDGASVGVAHFVTKFPSGVYQLALQPPQKLSWHVAVGASGQAAV
jgi:hypothetical protein